MKGTFVPPSVAPSSAARHLLWHAGLFLALLLSALVPVCADTLVQTFTLPEHFGVNHPDQVVTFDLDQSITPTNCYLLNGSGVEIPYQKLSGGTYGVVALTTDLPANTTKTFSLYSGRAPATFTGCVALDSSNPNYYQITNGLTGVRVQKVYTPVTTTPKSPIQGVQFRNGTWSPAASNIVFGNYGQGGVTSTDNMTVTIKEQGPIRMVIEVNYTGQMPQYDGWGETVRPAGAWHYTTTATVEKGQPSVLFETDTDTDSTYSLSLYAGVQPTKFRYNGQTASDPAYGHNADNSVYSAGHNADALVDINYATPVDVYYNASATTRPWMALWNPWAGNTGWYWQMYNHSGASNSNMMGIFAGPPSRLIGVGSSGPGIYNHPGPDAGITVMTW